MNSLTKTGILLVAGLLFMASIGVAETMYVTEDLTITLRTGPGKDRKIIAFPSAGRAVEVITPGDEYTEVKLSNGKQGWVLTRFLTDKEPADRTLARLQQQHSKIVDDYEKLKSRASQLDSDGKGLANNLTTTQTALQKLQAEHDTLKSESKEFLELKTKYDKSIKETTSAQDKISNLEQELQQLYSSQITTGMLYGGGFVVLGFIVGYIVKRPKRRSPLL